MKMLLKDLPELINKNIISEETAEKIRNHYALKYSTGQSRQQLVLGILGSLLVGMGIILIVAHNWDELSRGLKTFLAFLPLLLGQIAGGYVLIKQHGKIIWKESVATFIFFSVGACLALISQIYNISGDLDSFLLTWMLLVFPIVYIFKASAVSIFYQIGITWFACLTGYGYGSTSGLSMYWPGLLLILPYYFYLINYKREDNITVFHHWTLPLSLIIVLGTLAGNHQFLMYLVYFYLFNIFYLAGKIDYFKKFNIISNGYKCLGFLGMLFMLFLLSYDWFWTDFLNREFIMSHLLTSTENIISLILFLILIIFSFNYQKQHTIKNYDPLTLLFLPFLVIFLTGFFTNVLPQVLINLIIGLWALMIIRDGSKENNLKYLNFGLFIFSALIICRFFDWNLSFVLRGLAFIIVGATFFLANFILIKSRKAAGFNS